MVVGSFVVATLIAELPELEKILHRQIVSLIGVVPVNITIVEKEKTIIYITEEGV